MKINANTDGFIWESLTLNNCNAYLIHGDANILIDPGHKHLFDHVQQNLEASGYQLSDIDLVICTHGHPDHLEGMSLFKDLPAKTALHEEEWQFIQDKAPRLQSSANSTSDELAPDLLLQEGRLTVGGITFDIFHTPGHSPGSICIYWPDEKLLVSGDLIFKDGLGRTDLPGGNGGLIKTSIQRMAELEIEWLLPGHGEIVSGAARVKANFDSLFNYWFAYV